MRGKQKRRYVALLCVALCLLIGSGAYAWFAMSNHQVFASYLNVESPPIINIMNGENSDTKVINLEGVQLQQEQWVVFCCAPADPESGEGSGFALELAYTNNMGEQIDVYALTYAGTSEPASGDYVHWTSPSLTHYYMKERALVAIPQTTKPSEAYSDLTHVQSCNVVNYKFYLNTNETNHSCMVFSDDTANGSQDLYNESKVRFFALHITWPEPETGQTSAVIDEEETDIVYVTAKGNIFGSEPISTGE